MYIVPHTFGTPEHFAAINAMSQEEQNQYNAVVRGSAYIPASGMRCAVYTDYVQAFDAIPSKVTLEMCKTYLRDMQAVDPRVDAIRIFADDLRVTYRSTDDTMQIRRDGVLVFEYRRGMVCTDPVALADG